MNKPTRGYIRALQPIANVNLNASIHNRFDVEVIGAETGEIKQRAQAENVICNQLWTRLFTPNTYFNYIHYGTGSGTPSATDTSLFTFIGYATPSSKNTVYDFNAATGVGSLQKKITLSETTAVGSTLTEVGIGYGTTASTLCTHAMLKDMNGNQISISKTNTDIINIYATVFIKWSAPGYSTGYAAGYFTPYIGNPLSDWIFGSNVLSASKIKAGITPGGSWGYHSDYVPQMLATGTITPTFDASNKKLTLTLTRLGADNANSIKGIGCVSVLSSNNSPCFSCFIGSGSLQTTTITGDAIGTGDGATLDFETSFGMVKSPTIYVNGAQAAGVTVDTGKPIVSTTNLGTFFRLIDAYKDDFIPGICSMTECAVGSYAIYYNPLYASVGIDSAYIFGSNTKLYLSDDLTNWDEISVTANSTISIDSTHKHKKYWKIVYTGSTQNWCAVSNLMSADVSTTNVHFATPPATGTVITADYSCDLVGKDVNHVFDLTVTINLGEYTAS